MFAYVFKIDNMLAHSLENRQYPNIPRLYIYQTERLCKRAIAYMYVIQKKHIVRYACLDLLVSEVSRATDVRDR